MDGAQVTAYQWDLGYGTKINRVRAFQVRSRATAVSTPTTTTVSVVLQDEIMADERYYFVQERKAADAAAAPAAGHAHAPTPASIPAAPKQELR